jgi:hypothetical protein
MRRALQLYGVNEGHDESDERRDDDDETALPARPLHGDQIEQQHGHQGEDDHDLGHEVLETGDGVEALHG